MLVALPYILIGSICSGAAADGGPGWLHLIALWACWNTSGYPPWDVSVLWRHPRAWATSVEYRRLAHRQGRDYDNTVYGSTTHRDEYIVKNSATRRIPTHRENGARRTAP